MADFFIGVALALPAGFGLGFVFKSKILGEIHKSLLAIEGALAKLSAKA